MRTWTLLTWAVGIVFGCANSAGGRVCAFQTREPVIPRVRSNGDAVITLLLNDAVERSPTFRHIVDIINATDGIVYVEPGACRRVRACLLMSVTIAGPNRVLHIRVDTRDDTPTAIARIGHELQHAIEALNEAGVRSDGLLESFFARKSGDPTSRRRLDFETEAALKTEDHVFSEIMAYVRNRHVRSNDGKVLKLIERGEIRSETFRRLLNELDATDVIVYVEPQSKRRELGGYLVDHITAVGDRRYLRAVVRFPGSDESLIAAVAHELQHAKEIAEASEVRDDDGLRRFFERSGLTFECGAERECYETQTATDMERAIDGELRASNDHPVRR